MKILAADIPKMGVLELLKAAFLDQIPDRQPPTLPIQEGEVVRGVVTSRPAINLISILVFLDEAFAAGIAEHTKFHQGGGVDQGHDCKALGNRDSSIQTWRKIISLIFWHIIAEEYPQVFTSRVDMRDGLAVVSNKGSDWEDVLKITDPGHITRNFSSRIRRIILSEDNDVRPLGVLKEHEPIASGEKFLGNLNDTRLPVIDSLAREIHTVLLKEVPEEFLEQDEEGIRMHSEDEAIRFMVLMRYLRGLEETTSLLFWRSVRDEVPRALRDVGIGIRDGWQVVALVPEPEEALVTITLKSATDPKVLWN